MERVWGHVFTHTVTLSEANQNTWFSKLVELIQRTQQQQLWVSETKVSAISIKINNIFQLFTNIFNIVYIFLIYKVMHYLSICFLGCDWISMWNVLIGEMHHHFNVFVY